MELNRCREHLDLFVENPVRDFGVPESYFETRSVKNCSAMGLRAHTFDIHDIPLKVAVCYE